MEQQNGPISGEEALTIERVASMEAGPELDELVYLRVLGFRWATLERIGPSAYGPGQRWLQSSLLGPKSLAYYADQSDKNWKVVEFDPTAPRDDDPTTPVSTEIGAAWEVVEEMQARGFWPEIRDELDFNGVRGWRVSFSRPPARWGNAAPSVSLAICRAALIATLENPPAPST